MFRRLKRNKNLYCPGIDNFCVGPICRDWNSQFQKCSMTKEFEDRQKYYDVSQKYADFVDSSRQQMDKASNISDIFLQNIIDSGIVPDDMKEALQDILKAPSNEVAQELLKKIFDPEKDDHNID